MLTLASFMESLTHEQDKLVQMGTIKTNKDQALSIGVLNASIFKKKSKNSKQPERRKLTDPRILMGFESFKG